MARKKWLMGMAAVILKAGIAVFLSCGLASCFSLGSMGGGSRNSVRNPEPIEIVYEEIDTSELREAIQRVDAPGHGFIVEAYLWPNGRFDDEFELYRAPTRTQ
ncbi:MAG: hypothetical protein LBG27_01175 [Spirochaetaceae bacterium]|jgi:hypothetical protein|nr:hypothetical protein [Spirochaetaceae bacterium]